MNSEFDWSMQKKDQPEGSTNPNREVRQSSRTVKSSVDI